MILKDLGSSCDEPDILPWNFLTSVPLVVKLATVWHFVANIAATCFTLVNGSVYAVISAIDAETVVGLQLVASSVVHLLLAL